MAKLKPFLLLLLLFFFTVCGEYTSASKDEVRVGVVLNLKSPVGKIAKRFIKQACRDFYAKYTNYQTKLSLVFRDSENDTVVAASEALDLMKNEQVHAIIGPQTSSQAKFVIELGAKANVPIISFSATSPCLSPTNANFFIRTTHDDSFQVKALAAIVKAYGWKNVITIHEDSEYGNGLIPYLMDAFQEVNTRVPYASVISLKSNDTEISNELMNLKSKQTTIFLVHMTASLGFKLFLQANKIGMMKEGFVWIVTEGLSNLLDPVGSAAMNSMEGVLGLRTQLPKSKWRSVNIFGKWAYDTVWAVAMAVEEAGTAHSGYLKPNTSKIVGVDFEEIGRFDRGRKLFNTLLNTKFEGVSGNFTLVEGQRTPSVFEIFNVFGKKENIIGCWREDIAPIQDLNCNDKAGMNSTFKNKRKQPTWPGNTKDPPKKLKIGVPVRNGFNEYVKVEWKPPNNTSQISGFSIEVFKEVIKVLEFPLPYEFVPFEKNHQSAGTYNELLHNLTNKKYDAVVGDITIVAARSTYVDFTLPYSESGVSMVVLVKDENKNFWIFLKPLNWNLWLTSAIGFAVTGFVVWVLEHRTNTEFRGPIKHQLGKTLWFSFSTLVFAHRERLKNNLSKFVLIIWIFVVLILTQSYTASLTSMLTVQRLRPSFDDVKEIRARGYLVGYPKDSFVKDFLINQLNLNESNLKGYEYPKDYDEALSNQSVAAIFDEIPFIKLFLEKANYCSKYMMVGPTYRTGGLGFAFPQGSPLVSDISRAILNVTQDKYKLKEIEKTLGVSKTNCEAQDATTIASSDSLSLYSFGGLFIITGVASMCSLLTYIFYFVHSHWPVEDNNPETSFWSKISYLIKRFDEVESMANPVTISPQGNAAATDDDRVDEVHNSLVHSDNTSMDAHNSS
ncbi:glutamate receptor 2.8-like [Pistacia vera]|nr:glutamate receptor 2.8-like [Pistacia vera]